MVMMQGHAFGGAQTCYPMLFDDVAGSADFGDATLLIFSGRVAVNQRNQKIMLLAALHFEHGLGDREAFSLPGDLQRRW